MAVDVLTETVIDRPCSEVAAFAGDPRNAPRWYVNIEAVELKTPPPLAVGSRMEFTARFLGRRLVYTYEVIDHVAGERLAMRTAEGPFPMETTYTWAKVDDGHTRMTLRNRGEPSGFGKLAAPLMAGAMRRANQNDLARLKALLERATTSE
ncbi:MAG: SRPBCC family protein [Myxococcaceae bacterium]